MYRTALRDDAVLCAILQADDMHCFKAIASQFGQIVHLRHAAKIHMTALGSKGRNKNLAKARAWKGDREAEENYFMDGIAKVFLSPPLLPAILPLPLFCFPFAGREEGPKGKKNFFPPSIACVYSILRGGMLYVLYT